MSTEQMSAPLDGEYDVTIAERKNCSGVWDVEAVDSEGGIEQAIFAGPASEGRAKSYAAYQYGS